MNWQICLIYCCLLNKIPDTRHQWLRLQNWIRFGIRIEWKLKFTGYNGKLFIVCWFWIFFFVESREKKKINCMMILMAWLMAMFSILYSASIRWTKICIWDSEARQCPIIKPLPLLKHSLECANDDCFQVKLPIFSMFALRYRLNYWNFQWWNWIARIFPPMAFELQFVFWHQLRINRYEISNGSIECLLHCENRKYKSKIKKVPNKCMWMMEMEWGSGSI